MKKSDITKEVIRLSKEIAEVWRMEIYKGCWIITPKRLLYLVTNDHELDWMSKEGYIHTPIPDIADCLRKLREYAEDCKWEIREFIFEWLDGKSPISELHELLLSALLEVLKDNVA